MRPAPSSKLPNLVDHRRWQIASGPSYSMTLGERSDLQRLSQSTCDAAEHRHRVTTVIEGVVKVPEGIGKGPPQDSISKLPKSLFSYLAYAYRFYIGCGDDLLFPREEAKLLQLACQKTKLLANRPLERPLGLGLEPLSIPPKHGTLHGLDIQILDIPSGPLCLKRKMDPELLYQLRQGQPSIGLIAGKHQGVSRRRAAI